MDFLKVIRSLEELLYEVMTWLVFYPRTMWRIVAHPAATTRYSEDEETQAAAEQYTDTLSPPLLLMLRALAFSIFPLVAATTLLGRRRLALDRKALRGPFFSQCYLTAPFALMLSAGLVLMRMPTDAAKLAGAVLALAGIAWYLGVETGWFRRQLDVGAGQALLVAVGIFLKASFYWALLAAGLAALMG